MKKSIRLAACLLCLGAVPLPAQPKNEPASPWGFGSSAEWSKDYPKINPLMAEAGATWSRNFPAWSWIEKEQGNINYADPDSRVGDAKKHGIKTSGILCFFPPWASADGKDPRANPIKDIKYWETFSEKMMSRYKEDIKYWEIWNEFNGGFAKSKDKPKDYADLVVGAKKAARDVGPDIKVGLSCANFDLNFFEKVIKAGAAGNFDFVCVHPYENMGEVMKGGGEAGFLSLGASIRKMLKENGQDPDMPLWITEIGFQAPIKANPEKDALQADAIVKCYILSLAAGFDVIQWFEARGPAYGKGTDHGIIRHDWTKRPAYDAFKQMTTVLGKYPEYLGWLALGEEGKGYGFLFKGAEGKDVLVAWAPDKAGIQVSFPGEVSITPINGAAKAQAANAGYQLPWRPAYVTGLPAGMVATAKANKTKPFPWGGNFEQEPVVKHVFGSNMESGLKFTNAEQMTVVNDLTSTYALTKHQKKGNMPHHISFRAHPTFVNASEDKFEITVVAKRIDQNKDAKMYIYFYESENGYKPTGKDWNVPKGDDWQEHSWTVENANFVGQWGYNFCFGFRNKTPFHIKEVRVKRLP